MGKRRMLRSVDPESLAPRPLMVPAPLLGRIRRKQSDVQVAQQARDELVALARDLLGIAPGVDCNLDMETGIVTLKEESDGGDVPEVREAAQREVQVAGQEG